MSELRIIFSGWSPFYQATFVVVAAMLMVLAIGVVEGIAAVLFIEVPRRFRIFRARRYFNKVVRFEMAEIRRRQLDAVVRSGGR